MVTISDEEILDVIKSKGNLEAIKYVKGKLNIDLKTARKLVDTVIAKNPGIHQAKPGRFAYFFSICAALVVVAVISDKCGNEGLSKHSTDRERIENLFSPWDGSQPAVEKWIRQNIKDPDSYKHLNTKFIDRKDMIDVITVFTATNSFGGRVKATCIAQIDTEGNLLSASLVE